MAPGHATERGRLPQGLQALPPGAQQGGVDLTGASRNLDGGLDSAPHRQGLFHAGRRPNRTEHPRHRTPPQRGRNRLERIQQRHYGMQGLADTLLNLRQFCGT